MSYSQTQFIPGKRSNSARVINYIAAYNAAFPNSEQLTCVSCVADKYDKTITGSDSSSTNVSNNIKVSQIVNFSKGGTTQYGNFYLKRFPNINYLGRIEGMPGGSGKPPLNKF